MLRGRGLDRVGIGKAEDKNWINEQLKGESVVTRYGHWLDSYIFICMKIIRDKHLRYLYLFIFFFFSNSYATYRVMRIMFDETPQTYSFKRKNRQTLQHEQVLISSV
jgi:hypothetical protein